MITLPTSPEPRAATPRPVEYGDWQSPIMGGPETYLARLGNRWAIDFETPRLKPEPEGRLWASALVRSIGQTVRIAVPQPWLSIGLPGSPVVNGAGQTGAYLSITSASAGYVFRDGQFINVTDGTYLYLHQVVGAVTANGAGQALLPIWPILRTAPASGSAVEVSAPKIEGRLIGTAKGWTMARARIEGLAFSVAEVR
ncbi:hypothetical protein [Rhizorhabdus sp.]|uniref:hypothetical protein n=1 Tax=Rhizorhabdus sp. TaxID=1968843 RepID=UPI0035B4B5E1